MNTQWTQRERDLQYEIDELRAANERRMREQEQARRERAEEMARSYRERARQADTWPEALRKNIPLLRHEVEAIDDGTPLEEDFFEQSARACERALVIWQEVEAAKQAEIDELEERLAELRSSIVAEVADRLEAEAKVPAWRNTADALRADDPAAFLDW